MDRDSRSIIDCMMNLPLLYWASEEIGDSRFKKIAMSHADMTMRDRIRDDGTVNHIVVHDVDNGDVLEVQGGQGYNETSCWSRGLAWAIYGMAISYKYTGKKEYLETAIKCADYFIVMSGASGYKTPVDFITGKKSLDEFDGYVETLKNMGIEKVVAAKQSAYNRYIERE